MWRSVFHGDGLFTDWQADWLIDDPVAILTDQHDGAFYSTQCSLICDHIAQHTFSFYFWVEQCDEA